MSLQYIENNTSGDYSFVLVGSQVIQSRVKFTLLGWSSKISGQVLLFDHMVYSDMWWLNTPMTFLYS